MRFLIFILFAFTISISGIAQTISVQSFDLLERDLDARVHNRVNDQNGELCALIKVVTPHTGFEWEPDALGIVKSIRKTGEYWLYVPRGARRITIKHDDLGILRNYEYPIAIRSGDVYEMVLTTADIQVIVTDPVVESQWIVITSEPAGADVYINDEPVGITPYQNELPVGRYDWRINAILYKPAAGVIDLEAGDGNRAEIHEELEPDYGTLVISSTPESGAAITVNGFETGETTPASIPRIQSGEVLITLRLIDYETTNRLVELPAGQELPVDIAMRPTFAMVSIDTEPRADIYINDRRQGSGSWEGRLGSGMYTFEARLDRHRPATDRSQVIAREDRHLTLRPEPISGSLRVVSLPIGASIRLTDVATGTVTEHGTTPTTLRNLLIGDYEVELSRSGHATMSERVTIAEGETAEVNLELPAGMEVTITSEPAGADVYINDRRVGVTPYTEELGFGSHGVRLVNRSRTVEETIQVSQGGSNSFNFDVIECGNEVTFTYRGNTVTYGTIERGSLCWMDRNLGATRVPTSSTDAQGYGDLFQWGRGDDGHQVRTSGTTSRLSRRDAPRRDNFITVSGSPWDWRSSRNNDLWQGERGINNPCPDGWRVPTDAELNAERQSWGSNNSSGAYASTLKWPVGGVRYYHGTLNSVGSNGRVWSSSVSGTNARNLDVGSGHANMDSGHRANGMSVRCVRDL